MASVWNRKEITEQFQKLQSKILPNYEISCYNCIILMKPDKHGDSIFFSCPNCSNKIIMVNKLLQKKKTNKIKKKTNKKQKESKGIQQKLQF